MQTTIRRVLFIAGLALLAAGCATVAPMQQAPATAPAAPSAVATIHFHGDTDTEVAWMNKSATMQWGLLFARGDLVSVEEKKAALLNVPRYFETDFLNRMATVKGIPNGARKTITLEPGVYDWLVLIDIQGDGVVDGYLGTQASQGPLAAFEFLGGKQYFIEIDRKGDLSFRVEPDPALSAEENNDAVYLALMDSIAERLPELDDELLKEYVELIVQEIEALRSVRGNLCYDMIHGEQRKGLARAYEALPPRLKVRESALIDRLLRGATEEREPLSEEEFLQAMEPVTDELRRLHGDGADILDDPERFAREKDLGCRVYRDMLALTLLMPVEQAAPIWRYMFTEDEDEEDGEPGDSGPVTNT